MLEKFRRKIVLINALFIGVVLLLICAILFHSGKQAAEKAYYERFDALGTMLESRLLTDSRSVNLRDVFTFETENNLQVFLYDNGVLMESDYETNARGREDLLNACQNEIAQGKRNDVGSQNDWGGSKLQKDFRVAVHRDSYLVRYRRIPMADQAKLEIILAQSTRDLRVALAKSLTFFVAIAALGFTILLILNNLFAKKAISPAVKAQASQAEFLAAASHELKSPIAVIRSSVEMMAVDAENRDEYIKNVTAESHRMTRLIEEMLTLSRMDINQLPFEKTAVDTEGLLLSIYEQFMPIAQAGNHPFFICIPEEGLPELCVDQDRFVQVFAILLDNAFCHTKPLTEVALTAAVKHGRIQIAVIDHGDGIQDKERVFERFYQHDKSQGSKEHFGLGLSIAREIVQAMPARLLLRDTEGGGATFCVEIEL